MANPDSVIESLTIHDYGDGIRLREGATNWTVRDANESYLHDDCLENDRLYTGTVTDSLFDGCYVGFSARPSSSDTTSDGRGHTMTIDRSLVRLQPMPTTYKGPAPGHGGFFKWDDTGRSPSLVLHDNVFRVDQLPNHGSLGLPDGYAVSCSGNVIVWLGAGAFPEAASWKAKCPDTVILTDRAVLGRGGRGLARPPLTGGAAGSLTARSRGTAGAPGRGVELREEVRPAVAVYRGRGVGQVEVAERQHGGVAVAARASPPPGCCRAARARRVRRRPTRT